ncbi:MAG: phosphatase PAP2 family protein [Rhodospirillales bacterium]|nr:phosphatase PAP2 family protein [Rhodospirillales bacterium]
MMAGERLLQYSLQLAFMLETADKSPGVLRAELAKFTGLLRSIDSGCARFWRTRWPMRAGLVVLPLACFSYALIDADVALAVRDWPGRGSAFLNRLTDFGKGWVWVMLLIFILPLIRFFNWRRGANAAVIAIASIVGAGLLVNLLKFFFGRYRPSHLIYEDLYGFDPFTFGYKFNSFPSGHATTAGALFVGLVMMLPRLWPAWALLCGGIASTRVLLNAHYISDVIVGFYLGVLVALLFRRMWIRRGWLNSGIETADERGWGKNSNHR